MSNVWNYRTGVLEEQSSFLGYDAVATDGSIGEVTDESIDVGASHVVVDTGFWIFGKKRVIPAGAITAVDHGAKEVHLGLTKDDVKAAPDYVPESRIDTHEDYRLGLERYFVPWV